jgi:hypothetical protein
VEEIRQDTAVSCLRTELPVCVRSPARYLPGREQDARCSAPAAIALAIEAVVRVGLLGSV